MSRIINPPVLIVALVASWGIGTDAVPPAMRIICAMAWAAVAFDQGRRGR